MKTHIYKKRDEDSRIFLANHQKSAFSLHTLIVLFLILEIVERLFPSEKYGIKKNCHLARHYA